jgi:hypothetical protein
MDGRVNTMRSALAFIVPFLYRDCTSGERHVQEKVKRNYFALHLSRTVDCYGSVYSVLVSPLPGKGKSYVLGSVSIICATTTNHGMGPVHS